MLEALRVMVLVAVGLIVGGFVLDKLGLWPKVVNIPRLPKPDPGLIVAVLVGLGLWWVGRAIGIGFSTMAVFGLDTPAAWARIFTFRPFFDPAFALLFAAAWLVIVCEG